MRITRSMMVNNMLYWTEKQLGKLNDVSNVVASGKQINKPSDDPSATGRILSDRATLSSYGQYEANITQAETWIKTSSTSLDTVASFLSQAQAIMSSIATADQATKDGYLKVLESLNDQLMDIANSKYGSSYMYGGTLSDTAPFPDSIAITGGVPEDLIFDQVGNTSNLTITITDSTGTVVRALTTAAGVAGTNTISWDGKDNSNNLLPDGDYKFTVADTNTGDSVATYSSYRGDDQEKTVMIGEGSKITLNNNGEEIFSDALSVLSQAIATIKNSEDLDLGDAFTDAMAAIEAEEVSLANTKTQLEYKNDQLKKIEAIATDRISDTETGSTEEAAIKLRTQQTSYDVTLEAVASVLKMTKLTDLL